jgi:phosphoglucosamine mutase
LQLLTALVARGDDLASAAAVVRRLPQRLVNVRGARKGDLPSAEGVWESVRRAEAVLGDDGRVVVRSSGTEPLVRVMVEAPTVQDCERWCREISLAVERELGGSLA